MKNDNNKKIASQNQLKYRLEGSTLYLYNSLNFAHSGDFVNDMLKRLKNYKSPELIINLAGLTEIDSAGVAAIFYLKRKISEKNIDVSITEASNRVSKKLELFGPDKATTSSKVKKAPFLESLAIRLQDFFTSYISEFILLSADVFYWTLHDLFNPRSRRKGEVLNQAVLIGVNATLIVVVMMFIIGLVIALQSSAQLRHFGANIFVVDLTVIAMMAQMGPLITAILVAGRSGSAIAAEIATMKVTAELDALKTMGLNPIRFAVIPKIYGCLSTMPFLTILANIAGIAGGMLAAYLFLDISPEVFINRMGHSIYSKDIMTGIVKSLVYGSIIVLTGSFFGLRVKEGAEGVGKSTTVAVVVAISLVIIADSIMGLIFYT